MVFVNSLKNFDELDIAAVVMYLIGGVVATAGLGTIYGYDVTQSIGLDILSVPIALMAGAVGLVIVTNSVSTEELFEDLQAPKTLGFALGAHLPLLQAVEPTFYTNVVGQPVAIVFVGLGVLGLVLLSDNGV